MAVQRFLFTQNGMDTAQTSTAAGSVSSILGGVTATAAEINKLAGVTAGTTTASKVLVVGASSQLNVLTVTTLTTSGITLGGTAISSTATELDLQCDQSAYTETLTSVTPTMTLTKRAHLIDSTLGAQAFTPAAPGSANIGVVHTLAMTVDGGDSVLTGTNVVGLQKTTDVPGSATGVSATFNDVGDCLVLVGVSSTKWMVIGNYGVTIA